MQSRGAHTCDLHGTAEVVAGGYRYSEKIDGVGECRLDIRIGEDRTVTIEDKNTACKAYYCGARAAFDNIWFSAADEVGC